MSSVIATVGLDHLDSDEKPMPGCIELSVSDAGVTILIKFDERPELCAWATIPYREWAGLLEEAEG